MKRYIAAAIAALVFSTSVRVAGDAGDVETRYRRSSMCSMLLKHTSDKYADEIEEQFMKIPVSDKYNDHNLSVRVITIEDKKGLKTEDDITAFVERNDIGSRLVGKWFNRNILDGSCNLDLVKERGLYDASALDMELAQRSARGMAMLEDAGEDLIGNTYLLVNEVTYVDKNKKARIWGGIAQGLLMVAAAYTGNSDLNKTGQDLNDIISSLKGFAVKINTRLYRLRWDEEAAGYFYKEYYTPTADEARRDAFEANRSRFAMEYIGSVESKGSRTSFLGINEDEPELMIRKACQRAIDANVADLQKKYEQFRIKSPIVSVEPPSLRISD